MIIVATIIIFKQFLKKIILSIVEPQVFVLLLLSSPNFAQDANNGETLIYFSTNWFADFFCDWEKDPLFFALSSPFLANSLFFLRKERVRGSLEICRVPQNGRHWTSQHYLAGWSRNTKKRSKFCLINIKKLFQETLYDAKLKPSEEGLEETLEVSMKQVIMMMTVGTLNIDAGIIYFTIMKSYCTLWERNKWK